jgi:hypothetical protein
VLQDMNKIEGWISCSAVAKQWKRWIPGPGRTAGRHGREGERTSTAVVLGMYGGLGRASEGGIGRLFTTGYPERFDPGTADRMTFQGVVEEVEVVH